MVDSISVVILSPWTIEVEVGRGVRVVSTCGSAAGFQV